MTLWLPKYPRFPPSWLLMVEICLRKMWGPKKLSSCLNSLRDKVGFEPQSKKVRKWRGSSSLPFLTTVLWGPHPPYLLKNLEISGINSVSLVSPCKHNNWFIDWELWGSSYSTLVYPETNSISLIQTSLANSPYLFFTSLGEKKGTESGCLACII